jgi:hypothetical protein
MARPPLDVAAFLREPLRPASVATVTPSGRPALASMWFLVEDGRFWFHSPMGERAVMLAASRRAEVAVMVETFDPVGRVIKVRATGPARLELADVGRATRLYNRYLGPHALWTPAWRAQVASADYRLWSVDPIHGGAVEFPRLEDAGPEQRWDVRAGRPFPEARAVSR